MLELHRSRFVEWQPAAVVALAVTPGGLTVALARENGDLEIYDTADWRCTARVPGHDGAAISSVAWCAPFDGGLDVDGGDETCVAGTPPYRLLSAGLDGQITEWDLSTLRARGATDSHGGSVWALAAEPNVGKDKPQRVAAACDDGCVRLLTLTAGDGVGSGLHHRRSFNRVEGRLLSLSWLHDGKTVAAGSSRGCIHVFDCATFTELTRVTVGDGDRPGKRDTDERCVWALSYLPCGTLVSGTSDGDVTFWDKKFGTKIASHRQHAADVLALAASPCGTCVFASGVDSQIAVFEKVTNGDDSKEDTWTFTGTKRPHTHDVRALAMAAAPSGVGDAADGKNWYSPVLLSGGNDAQLLAFNALKFRKRHPVRVVSTPQRTPIAMTGGGAWTAGASSGKNGKNVKGKKRTADEGDTKTKTNTAQNASAPNPPLLLCDHARWLDLWRLGSGVGADLAGKTNQKRHDGTVKLACAPKHLLRAKLGGKRRTACAAVSPDGKLVAASDTHALRLFEVRSDLDGAGDGEGMTLRKLESPLGHVTCAHLLVFTPDGKVLVAVSVTGAVHVIDLESWEVMQSLRQHLPQPSPAAVALAKAQRRERREDTSYSQQPVRAADLGSPAVSHAVASADGQWLAVVTTSAGAAGRREAGVHVYNLDSLKLHVSLPPPAVAGAGASWPPVHAVAFSPTGVLALALGNNAVVAYDAESGKLSPWSVALAAAKATAPPALLAMPGQICGLSFDPTPGSAVLLCQTSAAIARVDLAVAPSLGGELNGTRVPSAGDGNGGAPSPKRRRTKNKATTNGDNDFGGSNGKAAAGGSHSGGAPKVAALDDPCLFLGYFAPGRALLVERPWKEVLKQIPEPLYRHRFGT